LEFNVPFQHKYGYIRDEDDGVAVASAEPYANHLHLSPDHASTSPLSFLQAGCLPFLPPNHQRQSTEGLSKD